MAPRHAYWNSPACSSSLINLSGDGSRYLLASTACFEESKTTLACGKTLGSTSTLHARGAQLATGAAGGRFKQPSIHSLHLA